MWTGCFCLFVRPMTSSIPGLFCRSLFLCPLILLIALIQTVHHCFHRHIAASVRRKSSLDDWAIYAVPHKQQRAPAIRAALNAHFLHWLSARHSCFFLAKKPVAVHSSWVYLYKRVLASMCRSFVSFFIFFLLDWFCNFSKVRIKWIKAEYTFICHALRHMWHYWWRHVWRYMWRYRSLHLI